MVQGGFPRDDNFIPTIGGVSSATDSSPQPYQYHPTTRGMTVHIVGNDPSSVALADNPEFFEDTSFVTGDSPATLDLNAALGRNATEGTIINDGAGNFTVAFSTNGTDFGDEITMKSGETIEFKSISVDSLRITWIADSSYRVIVL